MVGLFYTALLLSGGVARWWRDLRVEIGHHLPREWEQRLLESRSWKNADVHVAMWMGAAALLVALADTWRQRVAVVAGAMVLATTIEFVQGSLDEKRFQQSDIVANLAGITIGAVLASVWMWCRRRRKNLREASDEGCATDGAPR